MSRTLIAALVLVPWSLIVAAVVRWRVRVYFTTEAPGSVGTRASAADSAENSNKEELVR